MITHNYSDQNNRKSSRYLLRDSSTVMLIPGNIISYCVLDISKSGLAFAYNGHANKDVMLKNTIMTFFTGNAGSTDIPVQIVNDTELNTKHLPFLIDIDRSHLPYLRRCGVKFAPLSSDQKQIINHYIK